MTTIADTAGGAIRYAEETTEDTIPAVSFTDLRATGESLSAGVTYATSNEIRSDGQITDAILVDSEPSGGIDFELSYAAMDDFMEGALRGTWSGAVAISEVGDITAASSDNSYNSTVFDFTATNLVAGMWIRTAGFDTADNNGYSRVVSVATNKVVVSGLTLVDEGIGSPENTITIDCDGFLKNELTSHTYTIERGHEDASPNIFMAFSGLRASGMSLSVAAGSIMTGNFSFMGQTSHTATSVTSGTGAATAAPTNDVYNSSSNLGNLREGGVAVAGQTYITSFDINIDNGLRSQKAVGNLGPVGIGDGRCTVTGSLTSFFSTVDLYNKYIGNTATSIDFRLVDNAGNAYIIDMPKVKLTSANPSLSGIDTDVELPAEYQALRDPTLGYTISITRIAA